MSTRATESRSCRRSNGFSAAAALASASNSRSSARIEVHALEIRIIARNFQASRSWEQKEWPVVLIPCYRLLWLSIAKRGGLVRFISAAAPPHLFPRCATCVWVWVGPVVRFSPSTPLTTLRSKLLRFVPLRCGWKTPLPDNGSSIHQQPSPLRNIFLKKPHLHSPLRSLCDDSRGDGGEYH